MIETWRTRWWLLALILAALASSFAGDEGVRQENRDPRAWFFTQTFGDLPEELQTARDEGKLGLLLFFESEGCPYCRKMLQDIFSRRQVQDWFAERFISIAVDIHGDVELTDFDGITLPSKVFSDHRRVFLTPAISFIDLHGDEIYRHTGMVRSVEDFMLIGRYIEGGHYADTEFGRFAEAQGATMEAAPATPNSTDHRLDERQQSPR